MKIYFYANKNNINTYFIVNELQKEGILVDPINIQEHLIKKIEAEHIALKGCLATNATLDSVNRGISTLQNLYSFHLHTPNFCKTNNDSFYSSIKKQTFNIASFCIEEFPIRLQNKNICMYKIGDAIFSGLFFLDCLLPLEKFQLPELFGRKALKNILFGMNENTLLFSLSGPPTTIKTLKFYS